MPYCMYVRKSRADLEAEVRGEGETLARHKKALFDLAARLKINVSSVYSEIVSGETISARPVMQKVLVEVEQGMWDGVLVMEVERLARGDTIDQGIVAQAFKLSGTKIITPTKTYDPDNEFDEEYFEFGLFMSRREYKTINRRLQRGRLASVSEGKFLGSVAPFGYKRKKLADQKGYTLEPDDNQADVVRLIFEWYTRGVESEERIGVSKIVRRLNDLHIPTQKGGDWVNASVQGILSNPVYIGKIRWNWRKCVKTVDNGEVKVERPRAKNQDWILIDGMHEPIIDPETWETAQTLIKENKSRPIPGRKVMTNPLAGLVICGICGRRMVRRPYKNGSASIMCAATSCKNISSQYDLVEDKIIYLLQKWSDQYKIEWENSEENNSCAEELEYKEKEKAKKKAEEELSKVQTQLGNLYDLLEQGVYTVDKFMDRSKHLESRERELKEIINQFTEMSAEVTKTKDAYRSLIPKIECVTELYHLAQTPEEKNRLLSSVIDRVVYIKTESGGRWDPEKAKAFELELYPKF